MRELDLFFSYLSYHSDTGLFTSSPYILFFYRYGELFGWGLALLSLAILILSFLRPSYKRYQKPTLLLVLTFVIGCGLLINVFFKDHWGRPRPRQIKEFGGTEEYRPFYSPNWQWSKNPWTSFPSGHAAMGFYFITLAILGKRYQSPPLLIAGIFLTLFFGLSLSYARIAQGGHFFSDVVASLAIMWITPLTIRKFLPD